jgi:hypothetical protein
MWRIGPAVAAVMDDDANEAGDDGDSGRIWLDERKCFARQEKCDTERQLLSCGQSVVFSGSCIVVRRHESVIDESLRV